MPCELPNRDALIVITGAGGFIGGALTRYFRQAGFNRIRAVDKKPAPQWHWREPGVECVSCDLSDELNCRRVCVGAAEVYNLAADMGGVGFTAVQHIECLRNILINTHLLEAASEAGVERYFFSSTACVYNVALQTIPNVMALKESDAYPALAERGYGWEKLISEMFCQEYWAGRGMKTAIALAAEKIADGAAVNLGTTERTRVINAAREVLRHTGHEAEIELHPEMPTRPLNRGADNSLARRLLGWEPQVGFVDGLHATIDWYFSEKDRESVAAQLATRLTER